MRKYIGDNGEMDHITVDSCHSRWIFDTEQRRFHRILKGPDFDTRMTTTEWEPYSKLHLDQDSDSFVVVLNDAGTRMLRSWRHTEGACTQCGGTGTVELSMDDIANAEGG